MSIKIKGYNAISIRAPQEYIHYTHTEITQKLFHEILMNEIKKKVKFII
jgi:hypothetical protein